MWSRRRVTLQQNVSPDSLQHAQVKCKQNFNERDQYLPILCGVQDSIQAAAASFELLCFVCQVMYHAGKNLVEFLLHLSRVQGSHADWE